MKHSFILILILLSFVASAQYSSPFESVNVNLSYPKYFITDSEESLMKDKWELKNGFNNIGFGVGINSYFKKSSIEFGSSWYIKNYSKKFTSEYAVFTGISKTDCTVKYFSFPEIYYNRRVYFDSLNFISLKIGFSLLHPYMYSQKVYKLNGDILKKEPEIHFLKPWVWVFGIEYKKRFSARSFIRLYAQLEYKTTVDYKINSYVSNGRKVTTGKLTDDRLFLNFGVSFEYLFVKQPWKY